jgi:hypothetical protein
MEETAAALRLFVPRLISIKSASISASLLGARNARLLPKPPTPTMPWWAPPPLLRLRLPLFGPPQRPDVAWPLGRATEVSENGNGEGISSTESECGFVRGPEAMGVTLPFPRPNAPRPSGVGGGDVPSLLRSLRVMWARVCESRETSGCEAGERRMGGKREDGPFTAPSPSFSSLALRRRSSMPSRSRSRTRTRPFRHSSSTLSRSSS